MEWYLSGSRIKAIVGHFGSGKTEIALNLALLARERFARVTLADVDIVNPFFRSAEQKQLLVDHGVEVIHPSFALSAVDMPVLPAEIRSMFNRPEVFGILDVGGDPSGAAALGGLWQEMQREQADLWFVVNPFRPRSATLELAMELLRGVELRGRAKVTGLISNPNLADLTGPEEILRGREFCRALEQESGVPLIGEAGMAEAFHGVDDSVPRLVIKRRLKPEWMA